MAKVRRNYIKGREYASIYHGMVVKHLTQPHERFIEVKDVKRDIMIAIDTVEFEEHVVTVVYLKPRVKVIIHREGRKFTGESKCHEDDVFSPQVGFNIARARAEIKYQEWRLSQLCK